MFSLNSSGLMSLFEVNNSHQSFPSAPLEAARFRDKHDGLLRHSKVQSKVSYTVNVPIPGTFKKRYLSFTKTSWRWVEWCVECDSIIIKNKMLFHETDHKLLQKSDKFKWKVQIKIYFKYIFVWTLYLLFEICTSSRFCVNPRQLTYPRLL